MTMPTKKEVCKTTGIVRGVLNDNIKNLLPVLSEEEKEIIKLHAKKWSKTKRTKSMWDEIL